MSKYTNIASACVLALGMIGSAVTSANAIAPNFPGAAVAKINGEGFRICRAMGNSGYSAVARGILGDGGGGDRSSGYRSFQIRTCFQSRAQCEHFLDRIHHRISQIEQLHYIGCKSRA
ncbi:MAG: hypothetical protein ACR2O3_09320 [Rhizobiaceae bacterium]